MKIIFGLNGLLPVFKEAFKKWWDKDPFRESATIAYYAIFSIPALLAIIFAIVAFVFGAEAVNGQLSAQVSAALSPDTAKQLSEMIAKASEVKESVIASIVGFVTLVVGATGVFVQLQKSLNNIWEVKVDAKKQKLWWYTVKSRLFSFGIIVTLGFLMLVSMSITIALVSLADWIKVKYSGSYTFLVEMLNLVISLGVITAIFALVFKVLPDAVIKWRHVILGGFLTALLFILGKFALGYYFATADPVSVYGAAGSIVLILLWVSYSSMIVFFGAEFTKAFVVKSGSKIIPKKNAVHVPGLTDQIIRANTSEKKAVKKQA